MKLNLFQQKAFAENEPDVLREEEIVLLSQDDLKVELVDEKPAGLFRI